MLILGAIWAGHAATVQAGGFLDRATIRAIGNINEKARVLAQRALPGGEEIDRLVQQLSAAGWTDRFIALKALGEAGAAAKKAIPKVITLLADEHEAVRGLAEKTLDKLGPPEASSLKPLLTLLESANARVQLKRTGVQGPSVTTEAIP